MLLGLKSVDQVFEIMSLMKVFAPFLTSYFLQVCHTDQTNLIRQETQVNKVKFLNEGVY